MNLQEPQKKLGWLCNLWVKLASCGVPEDIYLQVVINISVLELVRLRTRRRRRYNLEAFSLMEQWRMNMGQRLAISMVICDLRPGSDH